MSRSPAISAFLFLFFLRLFFVVLSSRKRRLVPWPRDSCSIAIFLGSGEFESICCFSYSFAYWPCWSLGGHTTEALKLVSSLDFNRYTPRTYVVSEGDAFSARKALALEHIKSSDAVTSHVRDPSGCLSISQAWYSFHPTAVYALDYSPRPSCPSVAVYHTTRCRQITTSLY